MNLSAKKNQRKIAILEQWIEVQTRDGKTTTELFPSNEVLLRKAKDIDPAPEVVYRRVNFPMGVPLEYHWFVEDEVARRYGGCGIQRMTFTTWLEAIRREKAKKGGHIGATGVKNLGRPKERGECPCARCTRERETG